PTWRADQVHRTRCPLPSHHDPRSFGDPRLGVPADNACRSVNGVIATISVDILERLPIFESHDFAQAHVLPSGSTYRVASTVSVVIDHSESSLGCPHLTESGP